MGTGERIRQAREARGLSMSDLARAAGISAGAVSRIERGEPGSATLQRLAQALGVQPGSLLDEAPRPRQVAESLRPQDGHVAEVITMVARVMPTLPPAGQARVLSVVRAILS